MRSAAEIHFRLRQEARNFWLWAHPPALPEAVLRPMISRPTPLEPLPAAGIVRRLLDGTHYARELSLRARRIAAGELPAFATWIQPEGPIRWRRDYRHGHETAAVYFRSVPYLDFARAGDHKWIWEINRHQHLAALAQAWELDPQPSYIEGIENQLESWLEQNPPQAGINWTSALEVAFRALSWIWIWHWAGSALSRPLARKMLTALYHHGLHLEANLSIYFSPNTHLLGEALVLDALGRLFPAFPGAASWRKAGTREMALALERQVGADGGHFEQSTYYHVYALDMFLLHRVLAGPGTAAEQEKLARMADFLSVVLGDQGRIPLLGDDDGGRLFSPFGARDTFGRGTLAAYGTLAGGSVPKGVEAREAAAEIAAWWMGERVEHWLETADAPPARRSRLFAGTGLAVGEARDAQILADVGPMGPGTAGHSHADALHVIVRRGERELLIDPGTATYIADPAKRNRFRSTAAHNTVTIGPGDPDQATPAGPFRWLDRPTVQLHQWRSEPAEDIWSAECQYRDVRHRRLFRWDKAALRLWIADHIEWKNPGRIRPLAQFWQLGEAPETVSESTIFCSGARLTLESGSELTIEKTERSLVLGQLQESWTAVTRWQSSSPATRVALVDWEPEAGPLQLSACWNGHSVAMQAQSNRDLPPLVASLVWDVETS